MDDGEAAGDSIPLSATGPFSATSVARTLVRSAQTAALATLTPDSGAPFASLVTLATDPAGAPILLLSQLAVHTRNIGADARIALLIEEKRRDNPLTAARVTVTGRIAPLDEPESLPARRRFLAKHPDAAFYSEFSDFASYRVDVDSLHLVAGFGRIVDIAAKTYLVDCGDCGELLEAEEAAIAHMNADHRDAIELYATRLAGAPPGDWRITGLDPDGLDMRSEAGTCRLTFPDRIRGPGPLRAMLKRLADEARK